jgi:putative mRNA 3-end processing factor
MILELDDVRILFEYGMLPGKPPTFPMQPDPVDIVMLTHAHLDHSGMIPWRFSRYDQKILTTKLTGEVANILHKDSITIAKNEGFAIPFSPNDVKEAKHAVTPINPKQTRELGDSNQVKFHDAGHIPGSIMFEIIGDKKILFTGDFNTIDTNIVKGTKPVSCDILFLEGTYAGRDHPARRKEIEKSMLDKIDEVITRGGIAILPAFAVSRSQEIAMVLKKSGYNVWFDGMGQKVSKVFLKYPRFLKSSHELRNTLNKINMVHSDHGRKLAIKKAEVILTSSGMMDGGPVLSYMNKLKDDKKNAVILTGYQVPESNARLLVDHKMLSFYGVKQKVYCEVGYFDFSAHAGHSELIDFAKKCNPEKIVVMHSDNRKALVEPLNEFTEVLTPKTGEMVNL